MAGAENDTMTTQMPGATPIPSHPFDLSGLLMYGTLAPPCAIFHTQHRGGISGGRIVQRYRSLDSATLPGPPEGTCMELL